MHLTVDLKSEKQITVRMLFVTFEMVFFSATISDSRLKNLMHSRPISSFAANILRTPLKNTLYMPLTSVRYTNRCGFALEHLDVFM